MNLSGVRRTPIGGYAIGRVRLVYGFTSAGEKLFWDYDETTRVYTATVGGEAMIPIRESSVVDLTFQVGYDFQ